MFFIKKAALVIWSTYVDKKEWEIYLIAQEALPFIEQKMIYKGLHAL